MNLLLPRFDIAVGATPHCAPPPAAQCHPDEDGPETRILGKAGLRAIGPREGIEAQRKSGGDHPSAGGQGQRTSEDKTPVPELELWGTTLPTPARRFLLRAVLTTSFGFVIASCSQKLPHASETQRTGNGAQDARPGLREEMPGLHGGVFPR